MNSSTPLAERFRAKIQRSAGGHWLWTGKCVNGYPIIQDQHVQLTARRLAYEWRYGPIAPGHDLVHRDQPNRLCVNPAHQVAISRGERVRRDNLQRANIHL